MEETMGTTYDSEIVSVRVNLEGVDVRTDGEVVVERDALVRQTWRWRGATRLYDAGTAARERSVRDAIGSFGLHRGRADECGLVSHPGVNLPTQAFDQIPLGGLS